MRHKDESGATADVRFGSKADIGAQLDHVRFTPESGHREQAAADKTAHRGSWDFELGKCWRAAHLTWG
jgi:hypothetical protein